MIKIAVCDDEKIFRDDCCNRINLFCKIEIIDAVVDIYNSGTDILNSLRRDKKIYDIIYLDIIMDDMSGIDVAREIRKFDLEVKIIFVSISNDYILDGYDVMASNYLIKDNKMEKFNYVLNKAIETIDYNSREYLLISNVNLIRRVELRKIEFIEVLNRTLTVHTEDEIISFNGKIIDIVKKLNCNNFILTHRSYLVNLAKIGEISTSKVKLMSGKEVLLSRLRSRGVKKSYLKFLFNK